MATPASGAASLSAGTLTAEERELVAHVASRREQLIELTRELISYDTTTRAYPEEPARQEQAVQAALADRLRAVGAAVDLWEPAPEEVADHPLSAGRTFGFAGRPQLAARVRGTGGGASVLFNGHIDVVPASVAAGWAHDPFHPQVRDGQIYGRGACDMKGGIAAMVVAAAVLAETGGLRGDVLVCTDSEEESSGVGSLACARHGVRADFTIVPEPTGLEVWPGWPRRTGARALARWRRGQRPREGPLPARRRRSPADRVAQPPQRAPSAAGSA